MRRLLVCYNPRASHHAAVAEEVLTATRSLTGWLVGRYEIKPTSFQDNVQKIQQLINDGDLVIVAGGDGTAAMVINGLINSGKDAVIGVLGYGNFNDIATMLGVKSGGNGVAEILQKFDTGEVGRIYPLEVKVDGKHWRYVPNYMTIGMFAQSTEIFDDRRVREKLKTGKKHRLYSIMQLAKWYFRRGKHSKLPEGKLNDVDWSARATDYIALNGNIMGGMMRGEDYYLRPEGFLSSVQELGGFFRLVKFMLTSMSEHVPSEVRKSDVLEFAEPSDIELHAEGEYERLSGVSKVEITKPGLAIKVILGNK